jgi:hypothetical protein
MKSQIIKDQSGKILGRVVTDSKSNQTAYAPDGNVLGRSFADGRAESVQLKPNGNVFTRGADALIFFKK